jgi:hypothetical protein
LRYGGIISGGGLPMKFILLVFSLVFIHVSINAQTDMSIGEGTDTEIMGSGASSSSGSATVTDPHRYEDMEEEDVREMETPTDDESGRFSQPVEQEEQERYHVDELD